MITPADLDRLMRQPPRPGHPAECRDRALTWPHWKVTVADRLHPDQIAGLARLRVWLGQHVDGQADDAGTEAP